MITILKLDSSLGHTLPRPHDRAISVLEMKEMLSEYCKANGWAFERSATGRQYYPEFFPEHLDTEHPVLWVKGTTVLFYAFTER